LLFNKLSSLFVVICLVSLGFTYNQVWANQIIPLDDFGVSPSIVIGDDGFPVIVYSTDQASIILLKCSSNDCSSFDPDSPQTLGNLGGNFHAEVTIGIDTFPVVAFYNGTNGEVGLFHCLSIDCQDNDPPVIFDSVGIGGPFPKISIEIGNDGFPAIVYNHRTAPDIKFVHCRTISCADVGLPSFDPPITVNLDGFESNPSMAIGTDNFPIISNADGAGGGTLEVHHCSTIDCTGSIFHRNVIFFSAVPIDTSIVIGTDTFPTIVYHDRDNSELQLVHCTSIDCSTNDDVVVLDSNEEVGQNNSIAIGIDGYPIISYQDLTNHSLKVVHCKNINCSLFDEPVVLDSVFSGIIDSSITIGSDGLPLIVYNRSTAGLNLVKCSTVTCNPLHFPPCSTPNSEDLIIDSSCVLEIDFTTPANVIVQNNSVLMIPNGITLTVPTGFNITILSGGGLLIEFGGTVIVVS